MENGANMAKIFEGKTTTAIKNAIRETAFADLIAAKDEFYSQITNGYSTPLPDGKLEINCIRK